MMGSRWSAGLELTSVQRKALPVTKGGSNTPAWRESETVGPDGEPSSAQGATTYFR
jgi:hypothetical protein